MDSILNEYNAEDNEVSRVALARVDLGRVALGRIDCRFTQKEAEEGSKMTTGERQGERAGNTSELERNRK